MKKYYLSTLAERSKSIAFSVVMIVAMAAMLFLLLDNLMMLLLAGAGVALVSAILVYYIISVSKAAVIPMPEQKKIRMEGPRGFELDLTNAVSLETIPVKNSQAMGRALAFKDGEGNLVGIIPTMFTSRQGVEAEPMAMELAQVLNLEFIANVPRWEYDEEAMKIHEKEVAEQEKRDAAARREGKKKMREAQIRKKMDEIRNEKK